MDVLRESTKLFYCQSECSFTLAFVLLSGVAHSHTLSVTELNSHAKKIQTCVCVSGLAYLVIYILAAANGSWWHVSGERDNGGSMEMTTGRKLGSLREDHPLHRIRLKRRASPRDRSATSIPTPCPSAGPSLLKTRPLWVRETNPSAYPFWKKQRMLVKYVLKNGCWSELV